MSACKRFLSSRMSYGLIDLPCLSSTADNLYLQANKLAEELNISLSAVYKTLVKLEELTLVEIDTFNFVEGKKVKLYKSRIGRAEITFDNNDATLHLYPNKNNEK